MFGLPMSTTLIMGGVMLFWVVYTIVFYVRTKDWTLEDADYDASSDDPGTDGHGPLGTAASGEGTR
ncbi:hypothetical protein BSP109_01528 [Brevibacterium sp. Mu109]|uniref:Uncharacterized protein n=1 Tax=Brevibacterium yomogidense TaxID=946573 RepID=A0A1X6WVA4_9MICO|nr:MULTISPECIES: hypothetical protein [Brevibacterium]SLM89325.1 hypothetical protein FM105_01375 [Brevibacterium yomogidense]SMX79352.1 hypothetical protein BSP109_01528 [Brevibacterium sp. Mu109]